ncbi:MAG: Predicted L-lactate dehydrogenase, Fe-S oxidoreductase subunit YkgE, partial [uncultured Rubrobacteraceae bacterium]
RRGGAVLRVRGDVRGKERGDLGGDAGGQAQARPRHRGRGLRRRGQLVPHAHRRRPPAPAGRRRHRTPGRDPGLDGGEM